MSEIGKLYPEALLEHHRAPRRSGRLEAPTHAADGHNPLCGDRVGVTLALGEGRVLDVRCEVKGCAICRAAGSIMAEAVAGRELAEVNALLRRFLLAIGGSSAAGAGEGMPVDDAEWGPLAPLLEARRFPNRRRCASLSWEVLERALSSPNG
jgi:nitrogen fixation NifU-like protein